MLAHLRDFKDLALKRPEAPIYRIYMDLFVDWSQGWTFNVSQKINWNYSIELENIIFSYEKTNYTLNCSNECE